MQDNRLRPPLWRVAPKMGQTWDALEGQVGQGAGDGPRPAVPYSAPSWRGGYAEAMLGQRRRARPR